MSLKKTTFIVILFWAFVILFSIISNEIALGSKTIVYLKTVPVDPRDLFMGDYVILNYEIAQLPRRKYGRYKTGDTVYVSLNVNDNETAYIKDVFKYQPDKNELYLKGKIGKCPTTSIFFNSGQCVKFGIESYYVKEGEGIKLEKDLRRGTEVKVAINKKGKAKVIGFRKN